MVKITAVVRPRLRGPRAGPGRRRPAACPFCLQPLDPDGPHLPAGQRLPPAAVLTGTDDSSPLRAAAGPSGADRPRWPTVSWRSPDGWCRRRTRRSWRELTTATATVECVYKPIQGERPLWDFPAHPGPAGGGGVRGVPDRRVRRGAGDGAGRRPVRPGLAAGLGRRRTTATTSAGRPGADRALPEAGWFACVDGLDADERSVSVIHADYRDLRLLAVFDCWSTTPTARAATSSPAAGGCSGSTTASASTPSQKLRTLLWGWAGARADRRESWARRRARDEAPDRSGDAARRAGDRGARPPRRAAAAPRHPAAAARASGRRSRGRPSELTSGSGCGRVASPDRVAPCRPGAPPCLGSSPGRGPVGPIRSFDTASQAARAGGSRVGHRADVRLRHHPVRRDAHRAREHLRGLRPAEPGLARRRTGRPLRPERHRRGRPVARAGDGHRAWTGRELAEDQIQLFREDMEALNVLPPTHYVGAVESIPLDRRPDRASCRTAARSTRWTTPSSRPLLRPGQRRGVRLAVPPVARPRRCRSSPNAVATPSGRARRTAGLPGLAAAARG